MRPDVDLISLRFGHRRGSIPPIALLSLTASLGRDGISCCLTDAQFNPRINPFSVDAVVSWIRRSDAPVIAFSVFNDAIPLLIASLDVVKDELQGRRVFVGGPGVVGVARPLLERAPAIEMVIVGEGETALSIAIKEPHRAKSLAGVYARSADGNVSGAGMTLRENLNALAQPSWNWAAGKGYSAVPWSTMRGCPFDCQFCEIKTFMGRRVTMRSISEALEDLECAIAAMGTRTVWVLDDTFTVNKHRVITLCRELYRRKLGISFEIFSRADTIDIEMMESLAEVGCAHVFFGLDGGDDEVLNRIAKGLKLDAAEQTVRHAARYFRVTASFVWGYPFESLDAFRRMLLLGERFCGLGERFPVRPQFHMLSPSAGTPLFEQFKSTLTLDLGETLFRNRGSIRPPGNYSAVLEVIAADPVLAAPFYRYQTPEIEMKRLEIESFNAELKQG